MNKNIIISLLIIVLIILGGFTYYQYQQPKIGRVANSSNQDIQQKNQNNGLGLDTNFGFNTKTKTQSYLIDLNNDGHLDLLLHPTGPGICGTGGCPLYIFKNQGNSFTLVNIVSIVQSVYIANTYTNGWRDIIIGVGGGGYVGSGFTKIQYNGNQYPSNPTTEGTEIPAAANSEQAF